MFQEARRDDPQHAQMNLAASDHFPVFDMDIVQKIVVIVNYE